MNKCLSITIVLIFAMAFNSVSWAYVSVKGYYKKNGTYVAPHFRSSPNNTKLDNWYNQKSSYPKSLNNEINPSNGNTNTIKAYKWIDKKGVTHFSDENYNQ